MIRSIKRFYEKNIRSSEAGVTSREADERSLRLATAALLIEAARADLDVKKGELDVIAAAIEKAFGIPREETDELIGMAAEEVQEATSFHQFTHLINKGFSYERKKLLVELLWRVVYADKEMEKHEEYIVRRVAELLYVTHKDFIDAKLRARQHMDAGPGEGGG